MHKLQLNEACPLDAIRGEQEGERGRKRQKERGRQREVDREIVKSLKQAERERKTGRASCQNVKLQIAAPPAAVCALLLLLLLLPVSASMSAAQRQLWKRASSSSAAQLQVWEWQRSSTTKGEGWKRKHKTDSNCSLVWQHWQQQITEQHVVAYA